MPIGASVTAGTSAGRLTNGYRTPLLDKLVADGWRADFVGTQTSGDMQDNTFHVDQQHEGYPGIRTQELANQTLTKNPVGKFRPNLLLLNVGTNDCSVRLNRAAARKAYSNMIDAVFTAPEYGSGHTRFLILSTLLPRRNGDAGQNNCTSYFNDEIRDLSRTHPRSAFLGLADMNNGSYITEDDLAPGDNLHPSAEGFAKMAEVWYAAIKVNEGKLSEPAAP